MRRRGGFERKFNQLYNEYSLLSTLQVEGESVYAARTGVITLAQGLLFSVYAGVRSTQELGSLALQLVISATGVILSILWYFFEQRNKVYYSARGSILVDLEKRLTQLGSLCKLEFQPFWTEVGPRVKLMAKWYQRVSAPLILRTLLPCLFVVAWFAVFVIVARPVFKEFICFLGEL